MMSCAGVVESASDRQSPEWKADPILFGDFVMPHRALVNSSSRYSTEFPFLIGFINSYGATPHCGLVRPITDTPASSEGRDSPAHGLAILAVIGGGPVDTPYRLIRGSRTGCGALPSIRMEPDRLKSSHVLA